MRNIIICILFLFVINSFSEDRKCVLICNDTLIQRVECKDYEEDVQRRIVEIELLRSLVRREIRKEINFMMQEVIMELYKYKKLKQ